VLLLADPLLRFLLFGIAFVHLFARATTASIMLRIRLRSPLPLLLVLFYIMPQNILPTRVEILRYRFLRLHRPLTMPLK